MTQTSALAQAIPGETGLSCCPNGFDDDGGGTCKPASTGTCQVVECGDADAEENNSRTFMGANWLASATLGVQALQVRFRAEDKGAAGSTGSPLSSTSGTPSPTSTGESTPSAGLSTGAKAAIGAVVPIAFSLLVLAMFFLYRSRKHNKLVERDDKAFAESKGYDDASPPVGVAMLTSGLPQ